MSGSILVGVCGGSGSGKTTLARQLQKMWGFENSGILFQDAYYIDQSDSFDHDGGSINYDHPDALDFDLMYENLLELKEGKSVEIPIYDFGSHKRKEERLFFPRKKIILVDGILLYSQEKIVSILDHQIFVDTPEKTRLDRRIERDTVERGRTKEGILSQFFAHVKPMHDQFIEPYKTSGLVVSGLTPIDELVVNVSKSINCL